MANMASATLRHGSVPGMVVVDVTEATFTDDLIDAYLARLGVARPAVPDLASLTLLLAAHVDRICYENIDIRLGRPVPSLDMVACAERVALHSRGGFCFLVVSAFAGLLRSLGFKVSLHTAVCGPEPVLDARWGEHVVALVHLGGTAYIADVGLGEGPRSPFRLAHGSWVEDGFEFALSERPAEKVWRFHNPANATGTVPGFTVDTTASVARPDEFQGFHRYYWTDPSSDYVRGPVVLHRKLANKGVLSLVCCTLRRTHPELGGKRYEVLATIISREEWFTLVREKFQMPLTDLTSSERDRLWELVSKDHAAWLAKHATPANQGLATKRKAEAGLERSEHEKECSEEQKQ